MNLPGLRHRLGLVVGKFSPLHLGHEHVIAQAISNCEQVLVLGYSQPQIAGCCRERREAWVARRFPQVINRQVDDEWVRHQCAKSGIPWQPMPSNVAPDAEQQAWLAWLLNGPLELRPDAMFASEPYLVPTCVLLSREFGHTVYPVCVDPVRQAYPTSATQIRRDVHEHREYLHPDVYLDFVHRVVLLGGESSGKTTLAQALASEFNTAWVPEYGRELWVEREGQLTLPDLLEIGRIQVEREDAMQGLARGLLFCDTSPLTTLGYAEWMFGTEPEVLRQLARRTYSLIVFCEPDFDFVQDGTRQHARFQQRQQSWYETRLAQRAEPVLRVRGTVQQRVSQLRAVLQLLLGVHVET